MRIVGHVTIGGIRAMVDWTVTDDGIESSGGLDASELVVSGALPTVAAVEEEVVITDSYDDMTVADLRTLLSQRGEPIYGNKSDLINRLRAWDLDNPDGVADIAEEASGDAEEAAEVVDESEGEVVE